METYSAGVIVAPVTTPNSQTLSLWKGQGYGLSHSGRYQRFIARYLARLDLCAFDRVKLPNRTPSFDRFTEALR